MRSATKHTALKCFGAKKHWRENVVAIMYRLPNVGANVFRRQNGAAKHRSRKVGAKPIQSSPSSCAAYKKMVKTFISSSIFTFVLFPNIFEYTWFRDFTSINFRASCCEISVLPIQKFIKA